MPKKPAKPPLTGRETRNLEMLTGIFRTKDTALEMEISQSLEPEASKVKNYVVITGHDNNGKDAQMVGLVLYPGLSLTDARAALEIAYKKLPCSKQPKGGQPHNPRLYRYLAMCFEWYTRGIESQIFRLEMQALRKDPAVPRWRKRGNSTVNCKVIALACGADLSVVNTAYREWRVARGEKVKKYGTKKTDVR